MAGTEAAGRRLRCGQRLAQLTGSQTEEAAGSGFVVLRQMSGATRWGRAWQRRECRCWIVRNVSANPD